MKSLGLILFSAIFVGGRADQCVCEGNHTGLAPTVADFGTKSKSFMSEMEHKKAGNMSLSPAFKEHEQVVIQD